MANTQFPSKKTSKSVAISDNKTDAQTVSTNKEINITTKENTNESKKLNKHIQQLNKVLTDLTKPIRRFADSINSMFKLPKIKKPKLGTSKMPIKPGMSTMGKMGVGAAAIGVGAIAAIGVAVGKAVGKAVGTVMKGIFGDSPLGDIMTNPVFLILAALLMLYRWLRKILTQFWNWIKKIFTQFWNWIKKIFKPIIDWFKGVWEGFSNAIKSAFKWTYDHILKPVYDGLLSAIKWIGQGFEAMWKGMKKAWNWFKDGFEAIVEKIKNFFKSDEEKINNVDLQKIEDALNKPRQTVIDPATGLADEYKTAENERNRIQLLAPTNAGPMTMINNSSNNLQFANIGMSLANTTKTNPR